MVILEHKLLALKEELKYQIGITLIEGVGDVVAKKLIAYCGSVEAVFKEKKAALLKIPGIGGNVANAICSQKVIERAEEEIRFIEAHSVKPLFYLDKEYPKRLKYCNDGPIMLYARGNMNLNQQKVISIVGTRMATEYGKEICNELVKDLSCYDVVIVSGLAYGIDICAHKAALKNNMETIAVVAHGHDRVYPYIHKPVLNSMYGAGGMVTEFISKTNPDRENFPKRNRIIAGLADATIVIESTMKGGALITAEIANSYNRDVFSVPGRLKDTCSDGCNWLIKVNKAALIESVKDIEYIMGWQNDETRKKSAQKKMFVDLSLEQEKIIDLLEEGALGIDNISLESQMSTSQVAATLTTLEFTGIVKCLPGKVYQLN